MTFEELLYPDSLVKLEALSEQELETILAPCLAICPPIDIKILQDEKLKLDMAKLVEKEKKKEEKAKEKLEKLASVPVKVTTTRKPAKDISPAQALEMARIMGEMIKKQQLVTKTT